MGEDATKVRTHRLWVDDGDLVTIRIEWGEEKTTPSQVDPRRWFEKHCPTWRPPHGCLVFLPDVAGQAMSAERVSGGVAIRYLPVDGQGD